MSDIPPHVVGSSLQAGYHQADVAKSRDAERADQARPARTGLKAVDQTGTTIETHDEDTAVFADAEGAGGQGRHSETEAGEHHTDQDHADPQRAGTTDDDGRPHIDIEA